MYLVTLSPIKVPKAYHAALPYIDQSSNFQPVMNSSTFAMKNSRSVKRNRVQSKNIHTRKVNGCSNVVTDLLRNLFFATYSSRYKSSARVYLPFVPRSRREDC